MEKPLTLLVQELEQKLIDNINESKLPHYVIMKVLESIHKQVQENDTEIIKQYFQEEEQKKSKKGDDK